jgi:hypothetical protein
MEVRWVTEEFTWERESLTEVELEKMKNKLWGPDTISWHPIVGNYMLGANQLRCTLLVVNTC